MRHRFDPVRDLFSLQERMNRLFEEAADRRARGAAAGGEDEEAEIERADWIPAADVYEDEREYTLALDLPGINRQALDVSLDENRLTIRGERPKRAEGGTRRTERPHGRFVRTFSLPDAVDRQGITADYKDGVLLLHLPKRQEPQEQRVRIEIK
ncbi:MAG TPA: Hsp20/alpha crystallin family protein [Pyrinomonadaceae bacterium]|nr:Hsp20/alpha crystallin family protein [Pyrinomonadaceae bacterium]